MSSKHTPGPWAYQEDSDAYTHIVRGPNNRFICQLAQTTSSEIEANARLIAAAPELLEAAMAFIAPFDGIEAVQDSDIAKARAAIAKATRGAQ
ncbi:hypothetical protein QEK83_002441 [Stenotrophomonas maltophilia]|uniref:Uncharacterized protein n=1 Tax=Stenotrophomonas maltophilia TaxID=40324 RepID=A0AAI9FZT7_STEMA|nr:hypothetical protein [Stenotrophomonas maltophilia]